MKPQGERKRYLCIGIIWSILLVIGMQGCAKYKAYEAVFPPPESSLSGYRLIVIDNTNPRDPLYLAMENVLKAQLTAIEPGNINPSQPVEQIEQELALFNYNPKIERVSDNRKAIMGYTIQSAKTYTRDRRVSTVPLRRCNYMSKGNPCYISGTASVSRGVQELKIVLSGSIWLKNSKGEEIVPPVPFQHTVSDSGRTVDAPDQLIHKGLNTIAYQFTRDIVPHREKIKSEILRGGDAIAVELIENDAYDLAINRLDRTISRSSKAELEDLYNIALAYEILKEYPQALLYYQRAGDADPDQPQVSIALKRIRRILPD